MNWDWKPAWWGTGPAPDGPLIRPTIESLRQTAGHHSTDGTLWNFGARPKDDGSGYIVEFVRSTSPRYWIPPNAGQIGFDVVRFTMPTEPGRSQRKMGLAFH